MMSTAGGRTAADPPFYRYASKALAALAAAVVVAAPVLTAALADGHIDGVEWVYVVAAVAGLFVAPGAVFAAPRNATKPPPVRRVERAPE